MPTQVRDWRACKRLFLGHHPWQIVCVEAVTGHEGAGVGSATVVTRDAAGPQDRVAACFAAAGAMRRAACGGWMRGDRPARADASELGQAWQALRTRVESDRHALAAIDAAEVERRLQRVSAILHWTLAPTALALWAPPTGFLAVDGVRQEARELTLPLDGPWLGGLSIDDAWNHRLFLGETRGQFVLVAWSTSA